MITCKHCGEPLEGLDLRLYLEDKSNGLDPEKMCGSCWEMIEHSYPYQEDVFDGDPGL